MIRARVARAFGWFVLVGALASTAACEQADDAGEEVASASESALTFTGNANATTRSWFTFPFTAQVGDVISATLDWANASADLNVYLYDPTGKVVAYENTTTAKPSRATTTAKLAGTWRVAVKCRSGSTTFDIQLDVTAPAAPATARFPGDPGRGKVYLGAAARSQAPDALDPLHANLNGQKFSMIRLYYTDSISWSNVDGHVARGRIPAVSFKNGSRSISSIASGGQDAWIDAIGAEIKRCAPVPFYMTFFHEPEDNFPSAAEGTTFRAASRRIVSRWRAAGVKNFTYVADYFMTNWTFTPASKRDWRSWYPDWKGTTQPGSSKDAPNIADFYTGADAVVDVIGLDVYNWWNPTKAADKWESFQQHSDWAVSRTKLLGKPYCVGEYGTMAFRSGSTYDATRTRGWFYDAYAYMLKNDFVCAMYWNNDHEEDAWDPRLETNDPQKLRFGALAEVMARSTTAKPSW